MADHDADRNPLDVLAEEFAARCRRGETPSVEEYAEKFPELSDEIRELFPSVAMMEELRDSEQHERHAAKAAQSPTPPRLEQIGDYRIVREIGRGGMGVVYEAEQTSLGRRVAVKVLTAATVASANAMRRFQREAQAAAGLHHTNIVPVFGVGEHEGLQYYVMQFIQGVSLDALVRELADATESGSFGWWANASTRELFASLRDRNQPWPTDDSTDASLVVETSGTNAPPGDAGPAAEWKPDGAAGVSADNPDDSFERPLRYWLESFWDQDSPWSDSLYWQFVAQIGVQVANAVDYAHGQGVLHRDIKPGNLLLDAQGTVWVTDFGLAKLRAEEEITNSGDVVGTLRYMAPEQFQGQSDERSDVYALGLTLYELLAQRPAYGERNHTALLRQVMHERPPELRTIDPNIPRDLETIVHKAIAADPGHRYRTSAALEADLWRFLQGRPIAARRITAAERLWRWSRRNPAVASLSGLALVLLVLVAVVASIGYARTSSALTQAENERQEANRQRHHADREKDRAKANLANARSALEEIFRKVSAKGVPQIVDIEGGEDEILGTYDTVLTDEDAELLESLLKFFDRFAENNAGDERLTAQAADAHRRVGDIRLRLAQFDQAQEAYDRALKIFTQLGREHPKSAQYVLATASIHNELGRLAMRSGRFPNAYPQYREAQSALESGLERLAETTAIRFELAKTHLLMGSVFSTRDLGSPRGKANSPTSREGRGPRSGGRGSRGWGGRDFFRRLLEQAVANNRRALTILDELDEQQPDHPEYELTRARAYRNLAILADRDRDSKEAPSHLKTAIGLLKDLVHRHSGVPLYRYELALTLATTTWADDRESMGDRLNESMKIAQALCNRYPHSPEYKSLLASSLRGLATVSFDAEDPVPAVQRLGNASRHLRDLVRRFPNVSVYSRHFERTVQTIAAIHRAEGDDTAAKTVLAGAIQTLEAVQPGKENPTLKWSLERLYGDLSKTLKALGQNDEARLAAQQAASLRSARFARWKRARERADRSE